MNLLKKSPLPLPQSAALLAPIALWVMVWSGMQAGDVRMLFDWDGIGLSLNRLRATVPLFAGYIALMVILLNLYRRCPPEFNLTGPLGLTVIYGLVGAISAAFSPFIPIALYWAGAYISVPLVLLAIMWGPGGPERVHRLIKFNTLFVVVLVIFFFIVALDQLDLASQLFNKTTWINCSISSPWFGLNFGPVDFLPFGDGLLRPTGVGRFAALSAIIALTSISTGSWQHNKFNSQLSRVSQVFWLMVFLVGVILLWTSGARTAIFGFLCATVVIGVLYAYLIRTPKVLIGGAVAIFLGGMALLSTGASQDILRGCFTSSTYVAGTSLLNIPISEHKGNQTSSDQTSSDQLSSQVDMPKAPSLVSNDQSSSPTTADKSGGFLALSGRTVVWSAAMHSLKDSLLLGYGFNSDRLKLGTHMHNSYIHALYQTGLIGFVPFMAAMVLTWLLLLKAIIKLRILPVMHKHLVIQSAGIIVFFSIRTIPESSGAFYGTDWLLLAPILMYLQIASNLPDHQEIET